MADNLQEQLYQRIREGLLEGRFQPGERLKIRDLAAAWGTSPMPVRAALQRLVAEGALEGEPQRSVRVRSIEGTPIFHLTAYVPEDIGRTYSRSDMRVKPLTELLRRQGIVFTAVDQVVTAVLAQPREAEALGIAIGAPLLSIIWVMKDQSGRAVQHSTCLARPDMYHLQTNLSDSAVEDSHPLNMLRSHLNRTQPR